MVDSHPELISNDDVSILESFEESISSVYNAFLIIHLGFFLGKRLIEICADDHLGRG